MGNKNASVKSKKTTPHSKASSSTPVKKNPGGETSSIYSQIPIPDPPPKDENYDDVIAAKIAAKKAAAAGTSSSTTTTPKKKTKHPPGHGLAGHILVKQLLGTAPKNPTPTSAVAELKLEELDEKTLKQRLDGLDRDLASYKEKCAYYKKENEWYRSEIESTEKDTTEYIRYLITKKQEKQTTIDTLQDGKKKDLESFALKRRDREAYIKVKIEELKNTISELELKLEAKQQEMMGLSDIISKRSRHDAEIIKIRQDIADADRAHNEKVTALERTLLETRIKLQREADQKITEMENAAQEKATQYLAQHTAALELENVRLEDELRRCIVATQALIKKKEIVEAENRAIAREQRVREDLLRLRIAKVVESQDRERRKIAGIKSRGLAEKRIVFEKITEKYPGLRQDDLLPTENGTVVDSLVDESSLLKQKATEFTGGKQFSKLKTKQEKPVMKLVVLAGSEVPTQQVSKTISSEKHSNETITQWEIDLDTDDEFP